MKLPAILILLCSLLLSGCDGARAPGSSGPSHPVAAWIQQDVTAATVTHMSCGGSSEWEVTGDGLNVLRDWANGLQYESQTFPEGESPADAEGQEVWVITLAEGDYPGFAYYNCGPEDAYLRIEGHWYAVSNPSAPPVKAP